MLLAVLIFVAKTTLIIWQLKGLGIGWSAFGEASVALLAGVVTLSDVPVVWGVVWNATAAFFATIVISLLLDEADFFDWAAVHVARWGEERGRRLFVLIVPLGATLGALLIFFRRNIPHDYDVTALRASGAAIRDAATFPAGWIFRVGVTLAVPVLLTTLAALALRMGIA